MPLPKLYVNFEYLYIQTFVCTFNTKIHREEKKAVFLQKSSFSRKNRKPSCLVQFFLFTRIFYISLVITGERL